MTKEEDAKQFQFGDVENENITGSGGSPGFEPKKPTPRRSNAEVLELIRNAKKNRTRTKRDTSIFCDGESDSCCYEEFDSREIWPQCAKMYEFVKIYLNNGKKNYISCK
jgi:hypothetical protein